MSREGFEIAFDDNIPKRQETVPLKHEWKQDVDDNKDLLSRVWIESKKLWHIVGPAIFSRVASYSMNVITQALAGHLGDLELAAISIASIGILGFSFGVMVGISISSLCRYQGT